MFSVPWVATIIEDGGLFGFARLPLGSESWNGGADELNAATIRTTKIASTTSPRTAKRPLRLEIPVRRRRARGGRPLARDETIGAHRSAAVRHVSNEPGRRLVRRAG